MLLSSKTMDEHKSSLIPNSTQIPNLILDLVIPRISEIEGRCLLYICRRTFGFHKDSDRISFSQFTEGIKDRRGVVLDYGAGIARSSVAKGLKHLVGAEAIRIRKTTKGNYYQINLHMDVEKVVRLTNQFAGRTESGPWRVPKSVRRTNTQNLGNKEKQSIARPVHNFGEMTRELARKMSINSRKNNH